MLTFPIAAFIAILCALGAYGVQKRRKWAWYAGIVFQFFTAAAISPLGYGVLLQVETLGQALYAVIAIVGAIAIWSAWVAWWGRNRHAFGIDRKKA
jgi:hypothetical protein